MKICCVEDCTAEVAIINMGMSPDQEPSRPESALCQYHAQRADQGLVATMDGKFYDIGGPSTIDWPGTERFSSRLVGVTITSIEPAEEQ